MFSKDKFFRQGTVLIQELEERGEIAVISHLAIMETIHVIRRKIMGNIRQAENTEKARNDAMSKSNREVKRFIMYVSELQERGNAEIIQSARAVTDHHHRVYSKLYKYVGHVKYTGGRYRYVGLGHADIEHAFLASDAGVRTFRSTDGYFTDLREDQDFSHMSFDILSPEQ